MFQSRQGGKKPEVGPPPLGGTFYRINNGPIWTLMPGAFLELRDICIHSVHIHRPSNMNRQNQTHPAHTYLMCTQAQITHPTPRICLHRCKYKHNWACACTLVTVEVVLRNMYGHWACGRWAPVLASLRGVILGNSFHTVKGN